MTRVNREQLVAAALDLIDEEGGEALSMRALAKRVDRQVSSLYNHVASRGDLIEAVRARIVADIDTTAFRASMTKIHPRFNNASSNGTSLATSSGGCRAMMRSIACRRTSPRSSDVTAS